jgi:hypothetical protein
MRKEGRGGRRSSKARGGGKKRGGGRKGGKVRKEEKEEREGGGRKGGGRGKKEEGKGEACPGGGLAFLHPRCQSSYSPAVLASGQLSGKSHCALGIFSLFGIDMSMSGWVGIYP